MRPPEAERTLRRLVARLAAADVEDVDLVLDGLEPAQRDEVRDLLAQYGAKSVDFAPVPPPQPVPEPPPQIATGPTFVGFSPWVTSRLTAEEAVRVRMTPAALAALRRAALSMGDPAPETSFATAVGAPAPVNLFERFGRRRARA